MIIPFLFISNSKKDFFYFFGVIVYVCKYVYSLRTGVYPFWVFGCRGMNSEWRDFNQDMVDSIHSGRIEIKSK